MSPVLEDLKSDPLWRRLRHGVGKAVGDSKLESEGNADKIEGKVQNAIGGLKDTLKGK